MIPEKTVIFLLSVLLLSACGGRQTVPISVHYKPLWDGTSTGEVTVTSFRYLLDVKGYPALQRINEMGMAKIRAGKFSEASILFGRVESEGWIAAGCNNRAVALEYMGRLDEALTMYTKAYDSCRKREIAYNIRALLTRQRESSGGMISSTEIQKDDN